MRFVKHLLITQIILSSFLVTCTPPTDDIPPVLTVLTDLNGKNFQVPDTIVIEGILADEENIPTLKIHIDARDDTYYGPIKTYENSSLQETFRIGYPLADSSMPSGVYVITFTISDGANDRTSFMEISVSGASNKVIGTYTIIENNNSSVLHSLNANGITEEVKNLQYQHGNAALDSRNEVFYHLSQIDGRFQAVDLGNLSIDWSVVTGSSSLDQFIELFTIEDQVYITQKDGRIRGYEHTGQLYFTTQLTSYYSTALGLADNLLLSGEKHKTDSQGRITQYFKSSGTLKNFLLLESGDVKYVDGYENDQAMVILQYPNSLNIYSYNVNFNVLEMETVIQHQEFLQAVSLGNGDYYILTESSLYLIQPGMSQWNYNVLSTSLKFNGMAVDKTSGNVWLVQPTQIKVINATGGILAQYAIDNARGVYLRYNF